MLTPLGNLKLRGHFYEENYCLVSVGALLTAVTHITHITHIAVQTSHVKRDVFYVPHDLI
jgi:hypothetical protein